MQNSVFKYDRTINILELECWSKTVVLNKLNIRSKNQNEEATVILKKHSLSPLNPFTSRDTAAEYTCIIHGSILELFAHGLLIMFRKHNAL